MRSLPTFFICSLCGGCVASSEHSEISEHSKFSESFPKVFGEWQQ